MAKRDDNDDDNPGMPPGFREMMMAMGGDALHGREAKAKFDRAMQAINAEMTIEYGFLLERAQVFDYLLAEAEPLVTLEQAAAGFARHMLAARCARRLALATKDADPFLAHEWKARKREHQAAQERWAGWVGKTTGAEHSHTEPVSAPE